jgi:hypothetical protein
MEDSRRCDQCGKVFEPRREHSRFCSSLCWVTWNRENYHHDVYDRAMDSLDPAERKVTEGTFTGLRFVRNSMGYYVDAADFIQPRQGSRGGDAPVTAWTWRQVAPPASMPLPQRAKAWEAARYMHYRAYLADRPVGETIKRATAFLTRLIPAPADRIGAGLFRARSRPACLLGPPSGLPADQVHGQALPRSQPANVPGGCRALRRGPCPPRRPVPRGSHRSHAGHGHRVWPR